MNIPYHGKYEWLPILYKITKDLNPKKIVEFGPGKGFTTIAMATALKELNSKTKEENRDAVLMRFDSKELGLYQKKVTEH